MQTAAPLHTAPNARPQAARLRWLLLFLGGHVALCAAMRMIPALAIAHAVVCVAIGIGIAATKQPRHTACAIAYLAGAEVLWRLMRTTLFYEVGQYAIAVVLLVALARIRARRNRILALMYFVLLLPSAALTISSLGTDDARQALSFNLSGPLTLMLCVTFFSNVRLAREDLREVLWALMGPVLGIATVALFSTTAVRDLEFGRHSNSITAGGFGPNQVSAILGLGALCAILMLFDRTLRWSVRLILVGLAAAMTVQSALTFSRGGVIMALASVVVASIFLLQSPRARIAVLVVGLFFGIVGNYVVAPRLEQFTKGQIGLRYASLDSDGRTAIAMIDLRIFADNPVLGVGPGVAPKLRRELGHRGIAHTEFTRVLAEHGLFGLIALVLLATLGLRTFANARTIESRALVAALLIWGGLFLAVYAMRIAAVSFVVGLACSIAYSSWPLPKPRPGPSSNGGLARARPVGIS